MSNPVLEAIGSRRSIRSYTDEPVSKEHLDLLLAAAVDAPSARNSQPWHFTVVKRQDLIARINKAAVAGLKKSADEKMLAHVSQPEYTVFHGAPVVIFLSANRQGMYSALDCGIAVENIALAAHALGLGSVILGLPRAAFEGPEQEALERELCFPQGYSFQIAIAVGHPAAGKGKHPVGEGKITVIG